MSGTVEVGEFQVDDLRPDQDLTGELDAIIQGEREIRGLQARQLRRIADYATKTVGESTDEGNPRPYGKYAPEEIGLALDLSVGSASNLLELATSTVRRLPGTLARMERGDLDLRRVQVLADVTHPLTASVARRVEAYVLERAEGRNASQVRRIAARAVHRFDPDGVEQRHRIRKRERRVEMWPLDDGMAELRAYLSAPDATLIKLRLDAFAASMPAQDGRTMDQRRADVLRDLLLDRAAGPVKTVVHVTVPATVLADRSSTARAHHAACDGEDPIDLEEMAYISHAIRQAWAARTDLRAAYQQAVREYAATRRSRQDAEKPATTQAVADSRVPDGTAAGSVATGSAAIGSAAAGSAAIGSAAIGSAGADTTAGVVAGCGELAGYGTITAAQARELAAGTDATWHRLVTDPISGTVLDYGRTTYAPPAGLADFVRARDRHCIFPGCSRPSDKCDLDHRTPWPHGATSADNLAPLCRRHHQLKHETDWRVTKHPDGHYTWTSPAELEYVNHPEPIPAAPDPVEPETDQPPF